MDIKLDRGDYVGDLTPHAHFGISILEGGGAPAVIYKKTGICPACCTH